MKKVFKLFGILSFILLTLTSCSKDDDPKDNILFAGTYKGKITYIKGLKTISKAKGSVFVSKVGDTYSFKFSDDIPPLRGIKIEKGENKFDIGWGKGSIIVIDESKLNIKMIKDSAFWTANCKR
ncbi:MAG: hypothetical protein KGV59_02635 [Tenacibaculum sp.]|nr:hypothetical protein [Tenacibaculum sp.]